MADFGLALLDGLGAGLNAYGNMQRNEAQKAEEAKNAEAAAKLTQKLKEASQRFEESLKPAQYQTVEDTGPDGKTVKRTIKSRYDENKGPVEEIVGEAIIEPNDTRTNTERDLELYQRDPDAFSAMKSAGQRPLLGGGGTRGDVTERDRFIQEQLNERTKIQQEAITSRSRQAALDSRMEDYSGREGSQLMKEDAPNYGLDPNDKDLRKKMRAALRVDIFGGEDSDSPRPLMDSARGPEPTYPASGVQPAQDFAPKEDVFSTKSAAPKAATGSSRDNPAPAEAFKSKPPSGTWVKLPTGQVIQIP